MLLRSCLNLGCLCEWHHKSSTCSLKKLVVSVYRMGFKALLMGRMKITTQDVIVPERDKRHFPLVKYRVHYMFVYKVVLSQNGVKSIQSGTYKLLINIYECILLVYLFYNIYLR